MKTLFGVQERKGAVSFAGPTYSRQPRIVTVHIELIIMAHLSPEAH